MKPPAPVTPVEEPLIDYDLTDDLADDDEALTTPIPDMTAESDPPPEVELEPEPEPAPLPQPVRPAPDLEDVEDLMVVDDDIDTGRTER